MWIFQKSGPRIEFLTVIKQIRNICCMLRIFIHMRVPHEMQTRLRTLTRVHWHTQHGVRSPIDTTTYATKYNILCNTVFPRELQSRSHCKNFFRYRNHTYFYKRRMCLWIAKNRYHMSVCCIIPKMLWFTDHHGQCSSLLYNYINCADATF